MTALVSVSPETAQAVRDARHVLGRLAEAGFDFDEHGVPSLALIVDDLDVLLNMIDDARDPHSRKVFSLPDRDGYTLGDPKLVALDNQRGFR